jgi:hypothetical protein
MNEGRVKPLEVLAGAGERGCAKALGEEQDGRS